MKLKCIKKKKVHIRIDRSIVQALRRKGIAVHAENTSVIPALGSLRQEDHVTLLVWAI